MFSHFHIGVSVSVSVLFLVLTEEGCHSFHFPFPQLNSIWKRDKKEEYREPIDYIPKNKEETEILASFNGFYGLLTPDVGNKKPSSLLELFTGDGYIQGVFFHGSNITFSKTYIQTEKMRFLQNPWKYWPLQKIPNLFGVANTAFLYIESTASMASIYALFERDKPYKISIDIPTAQITTIGKVEDTPPDNFLAHPKYNPSNRYVETLDYRPFQKIIYYYRLEENLRTVLQKIAIPTQNMPIIHDFVSLPDEIILFDSSYFSKKTFLIRCNKRTLEITSIPLPDNFYIFHYSKWRETGDLIEIYAPIYDSIDMFSLAISGKYRKIVIDKATNRLSIERNPILEEYNLDFPISLSNDRVLLRSIKGTRINGFVICHDLQIIKTITLPDEFSICGEPNRIEIGGEEYILFMTFDSEYCKTENHIILYRIRDDWRMMIPIPQQLRIGFHSVFIPSIITLSNSSL